MTAVSTTRLSVKPLQSLSHVKQWRASKLIFTVIKTCPSFCSAHPSLSPSLPPSLPRFSCDPLSLSPSIPHRPVSSPLHALHRRVPLPLPVHPPVLNKQTSSGWLVSPIYNSSQTNYSGDVCQTQENTSSPTSERGRVKKKSGGRSGSAHRGRVRRLARRFQCCFQLCRVWKMHQKPGNNV